LRVFIVARAITSSAVSGFSSGAAHASPPAHAIFAGNSIISYLTVLTFIAVVAWVALGLLRQRPSAAQAVHVLLPVLLATSTVWVLSGLTTGWLQYVAPSASRPLQPQPWIGQIATALEFAVMLWAAMIYRRLSDTPAVSDEWRARAAWALSIPSLVSWGWIIYSTQQLRGSTLIPLYVATGSMEPQALASLVFRVVPSAALAFVMVADGLRALERDRKAIQRLSIWLVAVLVIAIAAGVYVSVVWIAVSHASSTNGGSVARYAILLYASLIGRWIVLPAVSLFMLWKWQRPRALPLPRPQSETEGGA
jgi:FtsH-binding integral membrane protein